MLAVSSIALNDTYLILPAPSRYTMTESLDMESPMWVGRMHEAVLRRLSQAVRPTIA